VFFLWDPTFILIVPAFILAIWAQSKVRAAYAKYSQVGVRSGLTGAQVAGYVLQDASVGVVSNPETYPAPACGIECIRGKLNDHYDPRSRTLRLSEAVYHGRSIAALGIAAHEAGHAIQHAHLYSPLTLRNLVYPVCGIGSKLAFPLFLIGVLIPSAWSVLLIRAAILLFFFAVFFTVLTLPVEFNASKRAVAALERGGYLTVDELKGAQKVLRAAAWTYVAAATMALTQLLRMILIARGRD